MARPGSYARYAPKVKGKTILVTGGTGSFGSAVVAQLLTLSPKRVIVFSRDEQKQFEMGNRFDDARLSFVIGDVRDRGAVDHAMEGVDYVFHAAALKQVVTGEFFPMELVKTNVLGSANVIHSAIDHGVARVVVLSTDKASSPVCVMGMTKALMEREMIATAHRGGGKTVVCATRFGNVLYSRGSVVPYLIDRMREGKSLTVTDPAMTRFLMTIPESLDLILFALTSGKPGEIYIRKAPVAAVGDLVAAVAELFSPRALVETIGARPGEKTHEFLISAAEARRARDHGAYYSIAPQIRGQAFPAYYFKGTGAAKIPAGGYSSGDATLLSREEIKALLLSLPEVRAELAAR
ncbi:polysaccharide biosynthesis protein [Patescibacteria group bacterium]|nr:polysaccharide biosynthesis protein [Patescibacteria group bacterium]MDE1943984.1 polysaccharide biosynthesis protein [Patescibacteria group bacterium]MDE1945409.1 polysaccharide biosynthesis protein [Patescibacteria group bacterium]